MRVPHTVHMPDQVTRRQHTVPKTLLRGFSDPKRCLAMKRRDGTDGVISLNNAAVRGDFYSYRDPDGTLSDAVETWLNEHVESPISEVLRRTRQGEQPSASDSWRLARFAASGLLRTATTRSYIEQLDRHLGPLLLLHRAIATMEIDPTPISPASLDRAYAAAAQAWNRREKQSDADQSKLRTFLREFDNLSRKMSTWSWSLHTAREPSFITADAPVATFAPGDGGWHGILPEGSPVFIPISSYRLLVGEQHLLGVGLVTTTLARMINTRLAREAYDAVFSDTRMRWPEYINLAPTPPTLPKPTITWSRSKSRGKPTFPATYPAVHDKSVRKLLDLLGAENVVE